MSLEALAEVSRFYGSNPDYVIAGGGNTSLKDGDVLYVKASGTALANAQAGTDPATSSFVKLDRKALSRIWEKTYPADSDEREKAVLADLLSARMPGWENKRPSVETLLHDLIPFNYVVHLHPTLVNGMTCAVNGETAMQKIFCSQTFGTDEKSTALNFHALWVPSIDPGYILSLEVKKLLEDSGYITGSLQQSSSEQKIQALGLFLQNHGVFVGANSIEEIESTYNEIIHRLEKCINRHIDFSDETRDIPPQAEELTSVLASLYAKGSQVSDGVSFLTNKEIRNYIKDRASFTPVSSAFTPDHIVYAGSDPLFIECAGEQSLGKKEFYDHLKASFQNHTKKTGRVPRIAAIQNLGIFGLGTDKKSADLALELFKDTVKIAVYSESFGGHLFMTQDKIDFINNWEVEAFRAGVQRQ